MTQTKVAAQVVLSGELIDGLTPDGLNLLGRELRNAVATASDSAFLSALSGNSGESSISSDSWATFIDELEEVLRLVRVGAGSKVYLIVAPAMGKAIAMQALANGATLVSAFQSGLRILIAERAFAIKPIGPNSYAHLTGVALAQDGNSPSDM